MMCMQDGGRGKERRQPSHTNSIGKDIELARRAAVAVLESGPWSPEKNRELVVLQVIMTKGIIGRDCLGEYFKGIRCKLHTIINCAR